MCDEGYPDDSVRAEAIDILHDIEFVYEKIDHFIKMNFSDDTYRISGRIKSHKSFIDKIQKKRKRKPNYSVNDIDDIIGFRIVSYTKTDVPNIIRRFFRILKAEDAAYGLRFDTRVKELVLYDPGNDDYRDQITKAIEDSGYEKSRLSIQKKDSKYSSFHLVITCTSTKLDRVKSVPVEFQFRSAFEDIWSELEHSVRYKVNIDLDDIEDRQQPLYDYLLERLSDIKRLTDEVDEQSAKLMLKMGAVSGSSPTGAMQNSEEVPDAVRLTLEQLGVNDVEKLYKEGVVARLKNHHPEDGFPTDLPATLRDLKKSTAIFNELYEEARQKAAAQEGGNPSDIKYALMILRLEIAFNFLQEGKFLKGREGAVSARSALEEAHRTYRLQINSMKSGTIKRYALAPYRYGQTLFEQDEFEAAVGFVELSIEWSKSDSAISGEDHWFHVEAPRFQGLILWNIARRDREIAQLSKNPTYNLNERRKRYLDAYRISKSVLKREVKRRSETGDLETYTKKEASKTANNIICYILELLELDEVSGGNESAAQLAQQGHSREETFDLLNVVGGSSKVTVDEIQSILVLETLCRTYMYAMGIGERSEEWLVLLQHSVARMLWLMNQKYGLPIEDQEPPQLLPDITNLYDKLKILKMQGLDEEGLNTARLSLEFIKKDDGDEDSN